MKKNFLALCAWGAFVPAFAQTALNTVTVTGNPLGSADGTAPTAQYSGTELLLRTQSTLGETLDGTPGVASTYFGPNASRPTIRGLDGDRVRVLNNGAAVTDVSGLSYDHAVSADPLSAERIEVLRGPGALLYGGNAVGGVVNVLDSRIAREPLFDARGGISGKLDLAAASGNAERSAAFAMDAGNDRYALHADAFKRNTGDVAVPVDLACNQSAARAICNSASDTDGAAVGGSVFWEHGYLGASASQFSSRYGTVAEDDVTIGMRAERYALDGEWRFQSGPWRSLRWHLGHSDYQHTEYEGSEAGTVFKSRGSELRLEARHAPWSGLQGVWGLQADVSDFSAAGEEAFAPYSQTRQSALFAYEELALPWGHVSAGARTEQVAVQSMGNPEVDRFVVGTRNFNPVSLALGALWKLAPEWQASANLAYSERAPKDYELFANGPHIATHAFEIGDASLGLEQSRNIDIGLQWQRGPHRFALSVFANEFANYTSQTATGAQSDGLDVYAYTQVRARFSGAEASARLRLIDSVQTLDLELRGDTVRARDLDSGEALPRIAPGRLGASLIWSQAAWSARVGASYAAAQNEVPAGQLATDAYTLWNAALSYAQGQALWFAKLDNAGDALAYSASSILTQTVPGKAPLPGRTLRVGVRLNF